ncbi:hypothetical protein [Streptomyces sp. CA2R106]|uniref:hypothetical protein n=1 Tax=Streptomyces sp. CA2R106 TaxID=3120153 RepID=UPI003009F4B9
MTTTRPLFLALRRLRLLAVFAGLAWLMGLHPGVPVRLLVVVIVVDAVADTGRTPAVPGSRIRPSRTGGDRR